ncbi:hypothetical protein AVEN_84760-1 [Araneus ventricosus]|uniref:Uncharacterized protein n=1 Tax=Araneus ventricosus TaxID=182803 RepID=A0A4Y2P7I5_ARAVE|nr:hypothetical protein AVEN_253165-1 [Araneus ventricosus]GBN47022.1 hypothetical protein AVEN_264639-1 [Araneus ventricosus]GBN47055.1 hypothetical protein AVEN_74800-1 [Araneus ventricosus]GBN47060.1 hypothetical protein AVEN_84760-1 [Araneus ventricosus]
MRPDILFFGRLPRYPQAQSREAEMFRFKKKSNTRQLFQKEAPKFEKIRWERGNDVACTIRLIGLSYIPTSRLYTSLVRFTLFLIVGPEIIEVARDCICCFPHYSGKYHSHVKGGGSGQTASVQPFTRGLQRDLSSPRRWNGTTDRNSTDYNYEHRATRGFTTPWEQGFTSWSEARNSHLFLPILHHKK